MASVVVRSLDESVKERLKARAVRRGRSLESEIREILEHASREPLEQPGVAATVEKGFGTLMHERFGKTGLTPKELRRMERACEEIRDRSMMRIPDFEA
jgi:plasmid stability protein